MKVTTKHAVHAGQGVPARFLSANSGGSPSRFGAVHLYSVAALTGEPVNGVVPVVERYTYDAYGKQKITDVSGNVTRAKSSVGWDRGFTGYIADNETGLLHARTRAYSPSLGRFANRMPWWGNGRLNKNAKRLIGGNYAIQLVPASWYEPMVNELRYHARGSYIQGRYNLYDFAAMAPSVYLEPFSFTGQKYDSADDAAIGAINEINPKSIKENKEYGGVIIKGPDGKYTVTPPTAGTEDGVNTETDIPAGSSPAGDYHTHGADDPKYDSENHSKEDKEGSDQNKVPGYIGTPSGAVKKYTPCPEKPGEGKVEEIQKPSPLPGK